MTTPNEGTANSRDDEARTRIHRNAARHAEANVYSMNNPYLTRQQKILVEAWYQFPIGVFCYALMAHLATHSYQYLAAFIFAAIIAGIAALIARFVFLPDRLLITLGLLFAGLTETVISLAFMALFLYHQAWGAVVIALGSATGVLTILAPSVYLYAILRPARGMHFKYGFAKSRFGITFPFEERE